MVSKWHRGPTRASVIPTKDTVFPDREFAIKTIIPLIESGETAASALLKAFDIGDKTKFALQIFSDERIVKAMMKRALLLNLTGSRYYHLAKQESVALSVSPN